MRIRYSIVEVAPVLLHTPRGQWSLDPYLPLVLAPRASGTYRSHGNRSGFHPCLALTPALAHTCSSDCKPTRQNSRIRASPQGQSHPRRKSQTGTIWQLRE